MRLQGHKPAKPVTVWLDSWPWFADPTQDVLIGASENVARIDIRPLVGCRVDLHVAALTPRAWTLTQRLGEIGPCVTVVVQEWLDRGEFGFVLEGGQTRDIPLAEAA